MRRHSKMADRRLAPKRRQKTHLILLNSWAEQTPLLGKGGVAVPSSKWSRSFGGAARSVSPVGRNIKNGVVRSTSDNRWLEPTTPSAPAKEASRHFLNGRSHPSLSKEGTSAFPSAVLNARVQQKMWDMASSGRRWPEGPVTFRQKL